MPRRPQSEIDPQLQRRTELAIQLAHEWMSVMMATQRGLARRLGVDQSVLSRFLSQQPGYEPARNRPRILKLLEDIEQLCSQLEDVAPVAEWTEFDATDDVLRWEQTLAVRLRQIRQDPDPGRALTRLPELSVQALHFPGPGRAFACINATLAAAIQLIAEWRVAVCSDRLVRETLSRLGALGCAALENLQELPLERALRLRHEARARSYEGLGRSFAGFRLDDARLVISGCELQIVAAKGPSEPKDKVWHNLLNTLEVMLDEEVDTARDLTCQAAEAGSTSSGQGLKLALADRSLSRVRSVLEEVAPHLLEGGLE